jgi:RNA polymerase sigma-70 factor (ECF subfamily)
MILAATMQPESNSPADDALARLRRGDRDALESIIPEYQHRLYRFLWRMVQEPSVADYLFQQTWVRVMERISTYRDRYTFDAWLFSIARNLAIDHLRRKHPFSIDAPDDQGGRPLDRLAGSDADPLEEVLEFERGAILAVALGELPAIHREVLTLRFEEGMKLEQIAEVANIPLSTVKSRLSRALESLRRRVESSLRLGGTK